MKCVLVTPPTIECVSLSELKLHLRLDSGSFSDNVDENQLIPPALHTVNTGYTLFYETMTLDVAPGGAGWAAGDTITGQSSGKTCKIVEVLTTTSYIIKDRSGTFTLGEILTNGTATADQGATRPTFASTKVEVLGYSAVVTLTTGLFTTGTLDAKIRDSDDGTTWTDWTGGAFTQVSTAAANDNAIQEIAYTGSKRYIQVAAKVLLASCPFSVSVIRLNPQSAENDLLNDIITASRELVEDITSRALLTQTWEYYLQEWPEKNYIKLPFGNLQTTDLSVKWKDTDGTETTLTLTTDYLIETNGERCGRIVLPYSVSWPSETLYPSNPIKITFTCGWTTAALVPYKIKAACLLIAADLYQNREGQVLITNTVSTYQENKAVMNLLSSARIWDEF